MIIGYPPGGANDLYARAVARHIGSHIPGHPSVVIQNMPGAGTLTAANHLYNSAAKDHTVIGLVAATIPLEAALGEKNVKLQPIVIAGSGGSRPRPSVFSPGTHRR